MKNLSIRILGLVLVAMLVLPALVFAQEDDLSRLISTKGPDEFWNQPWINGTRTDLAPKPEVSTEDEHKCVPSQSEVEAAERAWELQNSRGSLLAAPANAMALRRMHENTEKRCGSQSQGPVPETRSWIGLPENAADSEEGR